MLLDRSAGVKVCHVHLTPQHPKRTVAGGEGVHVGCQTRVVQSGFSESSIGVIGLNTGRRQSIIGCVIILGYSPPPPFFFYSSFYKVYIS